MIQKKSKKLKLSLQFEDGSLRVRVEGEVVRNLSFLNSGSVYKFNYNGEEYFFIYEEVGTRLKGNKKERMLFFYPLNVFEQRVFNLDEEDYGEIQQKKSLKQEAKERGG